MLRLVSDTDPWLRSVYSSERQASESESRLLESPSISRDEFDDAANKRARRAGRGCWVDVPSPSAIAVVAGFCFMQVRASGTLRMRLAGDAIGE